jgi:hypothetical protein
MDLMRTEALSTQGRFWHSIAGALASLARSAGCSADSSPLPEIREAARDLREWPLPPAPTR